MVCEYFLEEGEMMSNCVCGRFCFDMNREMPYHSLSEEKKEEIWDDGLHFTEEGYRLMGEKIAGKLIALLEHEEDLKAS